MHHNNQLIDQLCEDILCLDSVEECRALLEDLCTYKEVEQMAIRLRSAELLIEGKTYAEVISETGISSATLSRVSRCVQTGNGYRTIIDKRKRQ